MKLTALTYGLVFFLGLIINSVNINAQIISPGKLSNAHSFLEGISHCTSCHELGKPSINVDKCLDCHTPIQNSINELEGFHGRDEIIEQSCASCHQEHFGVEFDVLHFDSTDFDHEAITGFRLDGAHTEITCESCHGDASFLVDSTLFEYQTKYELIGSHTTFLGLESECATCHISDNVHGNQFLGETCESCHTTTEFTDAVEFDHNEADFVLTGKHLEVVCADCHESIAFEDTMIVKYVDIPFGECTDCHEDVHEGRLTELKPGSTTQIQTCETCHNTNDFHLFDENFPEDSYDHAETGYTLIGSHIELDCESCHQKRDDDLISNTWVAGSSSYSYPEPKAEECTSCHVDYHEGVFEHSKIDNDCQSCHTEKAWYPSTFGLSAHNEQSRFELLGAHIATPCFSCHLPSADQDLLASSDEKMKFAFDDISCNSCHAEDNPHGDLTDLWDGSKSEDCESCHTENSWTSDIQFDHEAITGYALTGKHIETSCASCHFDGVTPESLLEKMAFSATSTECESCHEEESPHQGQFKESILGPSCETCHTTNSFKLEVFDHAKTSFALDGAHIDVACVDCHTVEIAPDSTLFNRFFPLSAECSSCHDN